MNELKPCPFCGQKAKYQHGEDWFEILCLCGFTFQHIDRQYQGESQYQAMVRSWNTRPLEDAQAAEIEQLRKEVARQAAILDFIAECDSFLEDARDYLNGGTP